MKAILLYLAEFCGFLFRGNKFRFVDSKVYGTFGDDASVVLESRVVRLVFTRDRGQLILEFQPTEGSGEWFSPGLLRGLLTGDRGESEVLDERWALFLPDALDELDARLGDPQRAEATIEGLREQARSRQKALFG